MLYTDTKQEKLILDKLRIMEEFQWQLDTAGGLYAED